MNFKRIKDNAIVSSRAELARLLMKSRTDVHITHLENPDNSYATHKALEGLS